VPDRAQCDGCGRRHTLRRDGMLTAHKRGQDGDRVRCEGSGKPPRPLRFDTYGQPQCGECLQYLYSPAAAMLAEAIYSVSIEVPKSPAQLFREYFASYHASDHREAA
jgi:hypothetical protein